MESWNKFLIALLGPADWKGCEISVWLRAIYLLTIIHGWPKESENICVGLTAILRRNKIFDDVLFHLDEKESKKQIIENYSIWDALQDVLIFIKLLN